MRSIILVFGVFGTCYAGFSGWDIGGHGLSLGEISLDHGIHSEGGIDLGEAVNGWNYGHSSIPNYGDHHLNVIPVIKQIGIPVVQKVVIPIKTLQIETKPQEYPVYEIKTKQVPIEVEKPVIKTVEKKVPTPVERIIPVQVDKPVPFTVVKPVPVPVIKHIPIRIPIIKTIVHRSKGWNKYW